MGLSCLNIILITNALNKISWKQDLTNVNKTATKQYKRNKIKSYDWCFKYELRLLLFGALCSNSLSFLASYKTDDLWSVTKSNVSH